MGEGDSWKRKIKINYMIIWIKTDLTSRSASISPTFCKEKYESAHVSSSKNQK